MSVVHVTSDSSWPAVDEGLDSLEWRLRYSTPGPHDCVVAASIVAAYRALVTATRRKREYVVRSLMPSRQR